MASDPYVSVTEDLPWSAACERNREPILAVLREHFADRSRVLEIGSGTGQHAAYFAESLPHLMWQTSDRPDTLPDLRLRLERAGLSNTPPPLAFDVSDRVWPAGGYDALFTANTLHIMAWPEVERLFAGTGASSGINPKPESSSVGRPFGEFLETRHHRVFETFIDGHRTQVFLQL